MSGLKYARMIDPEKYVFDILNLLLIQLPPGLWWHSEDFETDKYFGHIFRGYFESELPEEKAYVMIADVTNDEDEPDISNISKETIAAVDQNLRINIKKTLPSLGLGFVRWMNSELNYLYERNILVTAYIIDDPEVGHRQRICSRLNAKDRKIAIEVCFNISDAKTLAGPIFKAMIPVGIA